MRIAYFEPLSRAWERTRVILWQPFDLAKWLLLAFAAWLAGLTTDAGSSVAWRADTNEIGRGTWSGFDHAWQEIAASAVWLPLVAMGIMLAIAFAVLLLWITSRFKFIFLDNLVRNQTAIVEPWKRNEILGNSLFLWRLCFSLACIGGAILVMMVVLIPAGSGAIISHRPSLSHGLPCCVSRFYSLVHFRSACQVLDNRCWQ